MHALIERHKNRNKKLNEARKQKKRKGLGRRQPREVVDDDERCDVDDDDDYTIGFVFK